MSDRGSPDVSSLLFEVEERLAKITPGEWVYRRLEIHARARVADGATEMHAVLEAAVADAADEWKRARRYICGLASTRGKYEAEKANGEFIAASPRLVRDLASCVRTLVDAREDEAVAAAKRWFAEKTRAEKAEADLQRVTEERAELRSDFDSFIEHHKATDAAYVAYRSDLQALREAIGSVEQEIRAEAAEQRRFAGVPCQAESSWHADTYDKWADTLARLVQGQE